MRATRTTHCIICFLLIFSTLLAQQTHAVIFVDADASGASNGTSWVDAYTSLAEALGDNIADELWVAEGVYTPGTAITDFFNLRNNNVYGGFDGTEVTLAHRDPTNHTTILDGDLDGGTNFAKNVAKKQSAYTDDTTLDGFTIRNGLSTSATEDGAGLDVRASSGAMTVANCIFTNNVCGDDGGAVYVSSLDAIIFTNCSFHGNNNEGNANKTSGGAIYVAASVGTFTLVESDFSGNSSDGDGGDMFIGGMDGPVQIRDSSFSDSISADDGGSLLIASDGTNLLENLRFRSVGTTSAGATKGGAIKFETGNISSSHVIRNCTFTDVAFAGTAEGGAIFIDDGSIMIDACTFTNVPVAAGSGLKGGAISIGAANTTPTITITNCSFDDVVSGAEDHGGAIYVADRDTTVTITDCFFTNVFSGGGGGAIYLANDRTNIMENLTFVNVGTISVLANSGGAINCDSADPLSEHVVRNCTFTDMDFAGSAEGGAVRLDDGKATIDACTFRNVTCAHTGTKGGALSIGGAATTPGVTITNCTFTGITGGSADDGGAVWIADRDAPVVVTDSAFTNIIGGASGGAIACGGDVNNTFRNLTFRDIHTVSTGASHGGAIALDSAEITAQHTILNCTFADVTLAGSDGGGGVYIDDGAAWIENCTFRDVKVAHSKGGGGAIRIKSGEAAAVMITNAMFSSVCGGSSNDAVARGGAIYVGARTEPVTIVNCQFSDVTTGPSGGAICSLAMNESLIRDCTFQSVSNTAGGANNGGAISLAGTLTNGTHTVRNCTFTDVHQSGSGGGGAIWNDDGNLVVDNCLFQNVRTTEPKGGGGAIECSAGNVPGSVWIGNSKFFNITAGTANSAAAHGGAIQIQERIDPVTIVGCVFSNTSSGVHGGAVYLGLATPAQVRTIDRCTFIKCTNSVATYDGGAVYFGNAGAGSRIVNSVFANNRSADDGGAVCLAAAGSTLDLIHCTFYTNSATDQGGGIYVTASTFLSVTNCIFRDNLGGPGDKDIFAISTATVEIDYSNIDQSESTGLDIIGANMFDTDPLFENPAGYDLRLKRESPLANEGLELDDVLVDRDGSPRPQGASSDIGAFEIPANLDAMIFRLL